MKQTKLDKLKYLDTFPQLPQIVLKIIEVCGQDETDLDELVKIISSDAALTSRLMQLLSSAWFNINKDIRNIESAVIYLGVSAIRNIAVTISVVNVFKLEKSVHNFNMNEFWHHSFKCAILAQKIAKISRKADPDEAFLAGLMHDIGKIVLLNNYSDQYFELIKKSVDDSHLSHLETSYFNLTYADVGASICRQWHLTPSISDSVLYLNDSIERIEHAAFPLVKIIYAVNYLCSKQHDLDELSEQTDESYSKIIALTSLDEDMVVSAIVDAENEVLSMAGSLGINIRAGRADSIKDNPLTVASKSPSDSIADELINRELQSKVRDYSLIYGTLETLLYAYDIPSILNALEMGIKIIFGVSRIFYFLSDDENKLLTGWCSNKNRQDRVVNSIAISTENRDSLLVKSLVKREMLNSSNIVYQKSLTISDEQIIRLLGCTVMFALPMYLPEKNIGVAAIAADIDTVPALIENTAMLAMLARLGAVSLDRLRYTNNHEKIVHKERASAASESINKVIHEINNPLLIITSYLKMLSLKLPSEDPSQRDLRIIDEEIERIAGLVKQISCFSQPVINQFEWVDVYQLFSSLLEIFKKSILIHKEIETNIVVEPDFPRIKTDKDALKQIFINLLKNAYEASDKGGKISIGLRVIPNSVKIMIDERKKISGDIEITIRDTGRGISDDIMKRIFEPYNSSKKGEGAGLGLSIVNTIVRNINGSIECDTKKNVGTEFKIVLPITSSQK